MGRSTQQLRIVPRVNSALLAIAGAAAAMSLLNWELLLLIGDEAHHMVGAASDLARIWEACTSGIPNAAALVRVVSSLFIFIFHVLVITPGASVTTDLAVFFGEMQYHFFHMLLRTWQLSHYLWTVRKRDTRTFVSHWSAFIFHTGIVWLYTSVIHLSLRRQIAADDELENGPLLLPPPPRAPATPASPDAAAIARAMAAARATATQYSPPRRSPYHSASRTPDTGTVVSSPPTPLLTDVPREAFRELGRVARRMSGLPSAVSSRRASALDRVAAARAVSQMIPTDHPVAQALGPCPEVSPEITPQLGLEFPPSEGEPTSLLGSRTRTLSTSSQNSGSLVPCNESELSVRTPPGELVTRENDHLVVDAAPNNLALSPKGSALPPASTSQHDMYDTAKALPGSIVVKEKTVPSSAFGERSGAATPDTGKIVHHVVPANDSAPAPAGHQGTAPEMARTPSQGTVSGIGLDAVPVTSGSSAQNPAPGSNPAAVLSGAQESPECRSAVHKSTAQALSSPDHSPMLSAPGSRKSSSTTPPKSPE